MAAAIELEIENECCICFGNLDNRSKVTLRCKHEFCLKCTLQQLKQKNDCPLCRRNVLPTNDYRSLFGQTKIDHNIMNTLMGHRNTNDTFHFISNPPSLIRNLNQQLFWNEPL